jgi:hypothetical protein
MQTATISRTAPLALWRIAEAFLNILHSLFGAPEDVAREHTLTRAAHMLMLSWLRVGEALMRRLLVIEAAAFPKPSPRAPRSTRQRARRLMSFTPENPEDWRVSFRYGAPASSPAKAEAKTPAGPRRSINLRSAWPLAERYEALLRVFNAPHAFARRLSNRLRARPHLLPAVLHAPEDYIHRVDHAEDLTAAAESAWRKPDSS